MKCKALRNDSEFSCTNSCTTKPETDLNGTSPDLELCRLIEMWPMLPSSARQSLVDEAERVLTLFSRSEKNSMADDRTDVVTRKGIDLSESVE